jgi:hypothetical protein
VHDGEDMKHERSLCQSVGITASVWGREEVQISCFPNITMRNHRSTKNVTVLFYPSFPHCRKSSQPSLVCPPRKSNV